MTEARRAVFLDRDGVIVEDVGHLHRPEDLRLLPGAAEAIRDLRALGFLAIVVTNQSAVARGLCSEEQLGAIHARLQAMLAANGARYDDLFYCPHHPTEGVGRYRIDCACRKPAPGMLLVAKERHGIDLAASFFVGDKPSDMEAARRAGCTGIVVGTGFGTDEPETGGTVIIADDLGEAAAWIASQRLPR